MNQRIAPNNQLPATHFIEVFYDNLGGKIMDEAPIELGVFCTLEKVLDNNPLSKIMPIAIFRIRENKLPTKHEF